MDLLSFFLYLILTWVLLQAFFYSIGRGKRSSRSKKLPPGPKPFPIIGNLHQLGDKPHKSLTKLAQQHGPLMSLKLGQVTSIVVSSAAMAKELLQTHDHLLSNRTIPNSIRAHDNHTVGLPWIPVSTMWRNLRRKKVQELLEKARESSVSADALDIGRAAFTTTLNSLSNTIFSIDLVDQVQKRLGRNERDYKIIRILLNKRECRNSYKTPRSLTESLVKSPSATDPCTMPPPYEPRALAKLYKRNINSITQVHQWEDKFDHRV